MVQYIDSASYSRIQSGPPTSTMKPGATEPPMPGWWVGVSTLNAEPMEMYNTLSLLYGSIDWACSPKLELIREVSTWCLRIHTRWGHLSARLCTKIESWHWQESELARGVFCHGNTGPVRLPRWRCEACELWEQLEGEPGVILCLHLMLMRNSVSIVEILLVRKSGSVQILIWYKDMAVWTCYPVTIRSKFGAFCIGFSV